MSKGLAYYTKLFQMHTITHAEDFAAKVTKIMRLEYFNEVKPFFWCPSYLDEGA
jgi:hypothetical protein